MPITKFYVQADPWRGTRAQSINGCKWKSKINHAMDAMRVNREFCSTRLVARSPIGRLTSVVLMHHLMGSIKYPQSKLDRLIDVGNRVYICPSVCKRVRKKRNSNTFVW